MNEERIEANGDHEEPKSDATAPPAAPSTPAPLPPVPAATTELGATTPPGVASPDPPPDPAPLPGPPDVVGVSDAPAGELSNPLEAMAPQAAVSKATAPTGHPADIAAENAPAATDNDFGVPVPNIALWDDGTPGSTDHSDDTAAVDSNPPDTADAANAVADAPSDNGPTTTESELPPILWKNRALHKVTDDVLAILRTANGEPTLFQYGGVLVRIRSREDGSRFIEPLTREAGRGVLDRIAAWMVKGSKKSSSGKETRYRTIPPLPVVEDFLSLPGWDPQVIPPLEHITEVPVFAADGTLLGRPGYHRSARLYYHPPAGLVIPPVSPHPTPVEVAEAVQFLMVEYLGDFPFASDEGASKAHALALTLLGFVLYLINAPTPLHVINAAKPGTGKMLLLEAILFILTGRLAETTQYPGNEEEMRKSITAALMEGSLYLLLDNINREVDSGVLASCITAEFWSDRILGVSKKAHVPVRLIFLLNGNNLQFATEMTRRVLQVRLEANQERPWERKVEEFRHRPLLGWAKANRGKLIWACLTIVQNWIAKGMPRGTKTLGRFERWAEVMGGILDAAGVKGFLANHVVDDVLQEANGGPVKAAAEVAGRGRIGDAAGAQGIEKDLAVAAQLQVLQTGAVTQGVVREGAAVSGLVIGEVELEQVQAAVEGVDETHPARQGVDRADTAAGDATGAVGDVIVEVPGGKHGSLASGAVGLVGAALAAALAAGQLLTYLGFHWKASRATRGSGRR